MVPFRIYDQANKAMWIVLNYHPAAEGNEAAYLVARESDTELDGEMQVLPLSQITTFRLVDFLDEVGDK